MLLGVKNSGESLGSEGAACGSLLSLFHINISVTFKSPINRNDPERLEKPTPVVPPRPTNAINGNLVQRETKEKQSEAPVVPPRHTEKEMNVTTKYSHRRRIQAEDTQNSRETEAPKDEADFIQVFQTHPSVTGRFQRSQKEKTPSFTASREPSPDPRTEEAGSEKEQSAEKNKQEKNAEPKQDIGGLLAGMFRKTPKDKSSSPALTVVKAESDPEDTEEEKTTNDKGGFFSGILKKSNKPADVTPPQENLNVNTELSASNDSLSENNNKEKGAIFGGMFKKKPTEAVEEDRRSLNSNLSSSSDNLSENSKEKGGFFSGILRKSPKIPGEGTPGQVAESLQSELSASNDTLLENKEKGGLFSGLLRKTKTTAEENLSAQKHLSASSDSLSETANTKSQDDELSVGSEGPSEENTKEKGGIFNAIFKKTPKPAEAAQPEEDESPDKSLSASSENLLENKQEKGKLFSGLLKKTLKASGEKTDSDREMQKESDDLSENNTTKEKNIFSNMFKKPQKPAEDAVADTELNSESRSSDSCENLFDITVPKEKKGGLAGIFKRSASIDNLFDEEKGGLFSGLLKKTPKSSGEEEAAEDKDSQKELFASNDSLSENSNTKEKSIFSGIFKKTQKPAEETTAEEDTNTVEYKNLLTSCENLSEENTLKEKGGGLAGIFKKSPKPAPRSIAVKDPLSDSKELSTSCDSLTENNKDDVSANELSASNDNLSEASSTTKEKKVGFAGMFRRTPKTTEQQESEDAEPLMGGGLKRRRTIKKKRRVVSFRIKKTLPKLPKLNLSSQTSDTLPFIDESVELQDLNPAQESTVEVEAVEMAAYPTEGTTLQSEQESNELMEWWDTVKGWGEWNEASNFQEEDQEMAMEQAADRIYMGARLFVHLFNQRGASLQQVILELLALADAADQFHKKTVSAAVGGGVASVCGSVATITGLILAPFTFGASVIVTAVGIGVATAGSITSATANITDTVHSNMDRKKVEKMIQGYQEVIKDIRECLEFVQEGMDTLQEWDFEKYSQSAARKALNHNIKHVMKEGGRAGKALMINTDKLISTVQVLGAAGGAAKAAQAISVTTGVMSALFLALDVFFLAKDSHELRKGAKTKFATKIREVCKELQDGLLELNKVKTQLQKTMDGIEVEEYEEIEEVEVEVDDDLESDPKKLAELEQELDLLEEKLDKKVEEEQKKSKEVEKEKEGKSKKEKQEKSVKEKGEPEETQEEKEAGENDAKNKSKKEIGGGEGKFELEEKIPDEEKEQNETSDKAVKPTKDDVVKEESQKGSKKDKETENRITAGKGANKTTDEKQKEKKEAGKVQEDIMSRTDRSGNSERIRSERESQRSKSSREEERGMSRKPEWREEKKEVENGSTRSHSSRSDTDRPKESKHEAKESIKASGSSNDTTESRRRGEEERGVRDWRAEMTRSREEKRENKDKRDSKRETERHLNHETASRRERSEREQRSSREESQSSHYRRETGEEKRGSRVESARRHFEKGEEERGKRREDRDSQRREHSRRGSRPRSNTLLEDGLYI
ncbi:hypothetical protein PAMP_005224 [Pampus punctatissimus]